MIILYAAALRNQLDFASGYPFAYSNFCQAAFSICTFSLILPIKHPAAEGKQSSWPGFGLSEHVENTPPESIMCFEGRVDRR